MVFPKVTIGNADMVQNMREPGILVFLQTNLLGFQIKLQRLLEDHDRRVNDMEIILYKKDEEERMGLFDSIYKKINDNERLRLMEEEKLRDEISYIKNEVNGVVFNQQNLNRSLKN